MTRIEEEGGKKEGEDAKLGKGISGRESLQTSRKLDTLKDFVVFCFVFALLQC